MGKVLTTRIAAESPVHKVYHEVAVNVDSSGIFRATIPDELVVPCQTIKSAERSKTPRKWDAIEIVYYRSKQAVECRELEPVQNFLRAAAKDFVACEVTTELVIVYGYATNVAFCKAADGTLHPNGNYAKNHDGTERYEWFGRSNPMERKDGPYYEVGFSAAVVRKKTFKRSSGEKVLYDTETGLENHHGSDTSWHAKLNAFTGINQMGSRFSRDRDGGALAEGLKEMPYSDEAAKFFYGVLLSICALADRIDSFFSKPEAVALAVKNQTPLLPAPKEQAVS